MTISGDSSKGVSVMAELAESEVTGELATIYAEIRHFSAVPYVSSLQRHVATMPGCLEYAWAVCRPAFASGQIPETAWRLASSVPVAPFPPLSRSALQLLGVDESGLAAVRNICRNFVRVAPVNLLFAGVVERLLEGAAAGPGTDGTVGGADWAPPPALDPMPAMPELRAVPADVRTVLMQLATELGGKPFVPGLYRLLAHWPAYLAHAGASIEPLLRSDEARAARAEIARRIVAAADDVLPTLTPPPAHLAPPTASQAEAIVSAIHTYRVTSPEMIVFGSLLEAALPPE